MIFLQIAKAMAEFQSFLVNNGADLTIIAAWARFQAKLLDILLEKDNA